jgi:hypothetical protein
MQEMTLHRITNETLELQRQMNQAIDATPELANEKEFNDEKIDEFFLTNFQLIIINLPIFHSMAKDKAKDEKELKSVEAIIVKIVRDLSYVFLELEASKNLIKSQGIEAARTKIAAMPKTMGQYMTLFAVSETLQPLEEGFKRKLSPSIVKLYDAEQKAQQKSVLSRQSQIFSNRDAQDEETPIGGISSQAADMLINIHNDSDYNPFTDSLYKYSDLPSHEQGKIRKAVVNAMKERIDWQYDPNVSEENRSVYNYDLISDERYAKLTKEEKSEVIRYKQTANQNMDASSVLISNPTTIVGNELLTIQVDSVEKNILAMIQSLYKILYSPVGHEHMNVSDSYKTTLILPIVYKVSECYSAVLLVLLKDESNDVLKMALAKCFYLAQQLQIISRELEELDKQFSEKMNDFTKIPKNAMVMTAFQIGNAIFYLKEEFTGKQHANLDKAKQGFDANFPELALLINNYKPKVSAASQEQVDLSTPRQSRRQTSALTTTTSQSSTSSVNLGSFAAPETTTTTTTTPSSNSGQYRPRQRALTTSQTPSTQSTNQSQSSKKVEGEAGSRKSVADLRLAFENPTTQEESSSKRASVSGSQSAAFFPNPKPKTTSSVQKSSYNQSSPAPSKR